MERDGDGRADGVGRARAAGGLTERSRLFLRQARGNASVKASGDGFDLDAVTAAVEALRLENERLKAELDAEEAAAAATGTAAAAVAVEEPAAAATPEPAAKPEPTPQPVSEPVTVGAFTEKADRLEGFKMPPIEGDGFAVCALDSDVGTPQGSPRSSLRKV